jgi:hypothetical protein
MQAAFFFVFVLFFTVADVVYAGYGDRVNGLPNWQERAILVLTNACRMSPVSYRDAHVGAYSILLPTNYPAVKPVYWNQGLSEAARFHSLQMADTCGMVHTSCNGESFGTRLKKFYDNKSSTIGENIATGNANPQATMKQWLMDAANNAPAVDLSMCGASRCDGHRWNIMNHEYGEIGAGYDSGAQQYRYFWCQDFGGGKPGFANPIVSGAHLFLETGKITFMANYFDSIGRPVETSVYIDNQKTAMTLAMGADSAGTYYTVQPKGTTCRNYFFKFKDSKSKDWRYPETGFLVTRGEGTCLKDFLPPESLIVEGMSIFCPKTNSDKFVIKNLPPRIEILLNGPPYNLVKAEIVDVRGRVWEEMGTGSQLDAGKIVIPFYRKLSPGVYLIRIRLKNGDVITGKTGLGFLM